MSQEQVKTTSKMKKLVRNEDGLIEGIEYQFNEDGSINWRKMINPKYLVPKKGFEGKNISELEDNQVLILLQGIKEIAQLRGIVSVHHTVTAPHNEYVASVCSITWRGNYETEGEQVTFSAIGDACPNNTFDWARNFLGAIAENRAFVRCVRNFLKINVVGQDEMGPNSEDRLPQEDATTPHKVLEKIMKEKKVVFSKIKQKLEEEKYEGIEKINSLEDLSKNKVIELIARLKKMV